MRRNITSILVILGMQKKKKEHSIDYTSQPWSYKSYKMNCIKQNKNRSKIKYNPRGKFDSYEKEDNPKMHSTLEYHSKWIPQ